MARETQGFTQRAVRWLADEGISQFIDFSGNVPVSDDASVHRVARVRHCGPRVLYVARDPLTVAYFRALAAGNPDIAAVQGSARAAPPRCWPLSPCFA